MFEKLRNEPYSYNAIGKILKEVEVIALKDEYDSINAKVEENIVGKNKTGFFPGLDCLFAAKAEIKKLDYKRLEEEILKILEKAGAIKKISNS